MAPNPHRRSPWLRRIAQLGVCTCVIGWALTVAEPHRARAHEVPESCATLQLQGRTEAFLLAQGRKGLRAQPLARAFVETACHEELDLALLLALAERESHFDVQARGPRGSIGLLQLQPVTARSIAVARGWRWRGEGSLVEAEVNLLLGAAYLKKLERRFGDWEAALAAYNMGPSRLRRRMAKGHAGSSRYARAVLARQDVLTRQIARQALPASAHER